VDFDRLTGSTFFRMARISPMRGFALKMLAYE
jgi:hypothetical protein